MNLLEKNMDKWTHTVQTCVIQGSTVIYFSVTYAWDFILMVSVCLPISGKSTMMAFFDKLGILELRPLKSSFTEFILFLKECK